MRRLLNLHRVLSSLIQQRYDKKLEGVCFGFSQMATQAFLSNDWATFEERCTQIDKSDGSIPRLDSDTPDIKAFLDGILLYQCSTVPNFYPLFQKNDFPKSQLDIQKITPILETDAIRAAGGQHLIEEKIHVFSEQSFCQYIQQIRSLCGDNTQIGLCLSNEIHAVFLGINKKSITYFDINGLIIKITEDCREEEIQSVHSYIVKSLKTDCISIGAHILQDNSNVNLIEFLNRQPDILHHIEPEKMQEIFRLACRVGNQHIVNHLLPKLAPTQLNKPNEHGCTPCHLICQNGHIEIFALLLKKITPKKVNVPNKDGWTPFHLACQNGRTEIVALFLNTDKLSREELYTPTPGGFTPFHLACHNGHTKTVALFLDTDKLSREELCTPAPGGFTPFHLACQNGRTETVALFLNTDKLSREELCTPNEGGFTPFHLACKNGHTETVALLLSKLTAEQINAQTNNGKTALHLACQNGRTETVALLLSKLTAEQINAQTNNGKTALHLACKNGHTETVALLLSRLTAEQINTTDNQGQTPLQAAPKDSSIMEMIRSRLEKQALEQVDNDAPPICTAFKNKRRKITNPLSDKSDTKPNEPKL